MEIPLQARRAHRMHAGHHRNLPPRGVTALRLGTWSRASAFLGLLGLGVALASDAAASDVPSSELRGATRPSSIIGGGPSSPCAWPSTVFLENCTGTLIHPEIVMYAAHCSAEIERVWFAEDVSDGAVSSGGGFEVATEYCMINPEKAEVTEIGPERAADFAFCKLARPVFEVPIVPPVIGCEETILTPGRDVTLVGFGETDQGTFAVKYEVPTVLHYIDEWGAAVIGGEGRSPCAGDSGGPAFVQLPDGSWRVFGIVSGPNVGNCGDTMWFATTMRAVPFIEQKSGIDVTPCHYATGEWNPSPSCRGFPLAPGDGAGASWADGCAGGPTSSWGEACGPAYDGVEDGVAPSSRVTAPEDRVRLDAAPGEGGVEITIDAEAADAGSGVATVSLVIDGEVVELGTLRNPPWQWTVQLPRGVWELRASARDWAGNDGLSAAIVVGVDEDPPPPPEASTSTGVDDGAVDSSGGAAGTSGVADESSGAAGSVGADEGSGASGCGCTASGRGGGWFVAGVFVLAWRRRRAGLVALVLAACSDDGAQAPGSDSSGAAVPAGSSGVDAVTGSSSEGDVGGDSSSGAAGTSGEGPSCRAGALDCSCTAEFRCDAGLGCLLDTCVPCPAGTLACPCDVGDGGEEVCRDGLACFAGLCAAPEPCPFPMDGICDEPQAGGGCQPGTDAFDCCAAVPGVCEEASAGGECPEGSDPVDCEGGSSGGTTDGTTEGDGGSEDGTAGTTT